MEKIPAFQPDRSQQHTRAFVGYTLTMSDKDRHRQPHARRRRQATIFIPMVQ